MHPNPHSSLDLHHSSLGLEPQHTHFSSFMFVFRKYFLSSISSAINFIFHLYRAWQTNGFQCKENSAINIYLCSSISINIANVCVQMNLQRKLKNKNGRCRSVCPRSSSLIIPGPLHTGPDELFTAGHCMGRSMSR